MVVDPKIPAAEDGRLDVGTMDEMRDRAAKYRGEAEGVEEAAEEVLGPEEDFADLAEE